MEKAYDWALQCSVRGAVEEWGTWVDFRVSGPCITKAEAVSAFLVQSQTCS